MWTSVFLQNFQVRVMLFSDLVEGLKTKSPTSLSCSSRAALLLDTFLNFSKAILLAWKRPICLGFDSAEKFWLRRSSVGMSWRLIPVNDSTYSSWLWRSFYLHWSFTSNGLSWSQSIDFIRPVITCPLSSFEFNFSSYYSTISYSRMIAVRPFSNLQIALVSNTLLTVAVTSMPFLKDSSVSSISR